MNVLNNTSSVLPDVVERLNRLSQEELAVVEKVLIQIEINRTVAELDQLTDGLRASGVMARLPEIIREVRDGHSAARA